MRHSRRAVAVPLCMALAAVLMAGCGRERETEAGEGDAPGAPAAVEPPRDPATVRSMSPSSGPPGTAVTVRAGGLPPGIDVEFGFGAAGTNFEILGQARTDSVGDVGATLVVPSWAEAGRGYMFVVAPVNQPPRAASDTFRVTARSPMQ